MKELDWDDEANIDRWCAEQREDAARYLSEQPVEFGTLGRWPAWARRSLCIDLGCRKHCIPWERWLVGNLRRPSDRLYLWLGNF